MIKCLHDLRDFERVNGTEAYARIVHNYIDLFYLKNRTLLDKVKSASHIVGFFRLWRLWIFYHDVYTLSEHFISREAFQDVEISCHKVVNYIRATRDFAPQNHVCLNKLGTDVCEQYFSKQGGMIMNRRVYNLLEMVESDGSLQRMKFSESGDRCPLIFPEHSKKKEIWQSEQIEANQLDTTSFPSDDEM